MTWRDKLRPASFRGVQFEVETDKVPVGRRVVVHEYPQRDKSYPEDMGRRTREYRLTGYVIGPDCFDRRDELLRAIETAGPGELVHPWLGTVKVQPGECEMTHDRREGGMVRFELTFHDADELTYPTGAANTAKQVLGSSDGLLDTALNRYREAIEPIDVAQVAVDGIMRQSGSIFDVMYRAASPFNTLFGSSRYFAETLVSSPSDVADKLQGLMGGANDAFEPTGSYSSAVAVVRSKLDGVSDLGQVAAPSGIEAAKLVSATVALAQDAVLVDTVRTIGQLPTFALPVVPRSVPAVDVQVVNPPLRQDVPVADDMQYVADAVAAALWTQGLTATRAHFQSLTGARIRVSRHLVAVARAGVGLAELTLSEPMPALVLAHRQYGDANRAAEIVARNRVVHPGFLPITTMRVLAR